MNLVTVLRTFNATDADLARSRLEAAGFHAVVMGEAASVTTNFYVADGGVRVQVLEDEAEEAREFLAAGNSSAE